MNEQEAATPIWLKSLLENPLRMRVETGPSAAPGAIRSEVWKSRIWPTIGSPVNWYQTRPLPSPLLQYTVTMQRCTLS